MPMAAMASGNPGYETAQHSTSSMVTGPSHTMDATAADIMMRWSPLWTIAPPLSLGLP